MDRCAQLAAAAALLALEDAGGDLDLPPGRVGAAVGSAHGGTQTLADAYQAFYQRGADRVSPFAIPLSLANVPARRPPARSPCAGPSAAPCTACAAGSDAIGTALALLRDGRADAMLAGGADAPLSPVVWPATARSAPSRRGPARAGLPPLRPRSRRLRHGRGRRRAAAGGARARAARGARIYAELAGYGSSCDADHLTDPDPPGEGPSPAMRLALADAGIGPRTSDTSTRTPPRRRRATCRGARDRPRRPARGRVVTKAMHGHTLGGAGGLEATRNSFLQPPRPGAAREPPGAGRGQRLDYVADGPRSTRPSRRPRTASGSAATMRRSCCADTPFQPRKNS